MGELEGNPIIEIVKYFIMPEYGRMTIRRPEKFGGDLELGLEDLLNTYSSGDLHPLDLKNAVSDYLIDMLGPVREYMEGV